MGYDPHWWNTVCLLHMDGANNGTTFTDETGINTVVVGGAAVTSTTLPKFGTASGYFPGGNTDRVRLEPAWSNDHNFAGGDLTIECWCKANAPAVQYMTMLEKDNGAFGAGSWSLRMNQTGASAGDIAFMLADYHATNPMLLSGTGFADNAWHHVAVTRNEDRWKLFVDGAVAASATFATSVTDLNSDGAVTYIYIGNSKTASRGWTGYLDDVRIAKARAYYTTAFTPPSSALPDSPDTGSRAGPAGPAGPDGVNIPGDPGADGGVAVSPITLPPAPPAYDAAEQRAVRSLIERAFR